MRHTHVNRGTRCQNEGIFELYVTDCIIIHIHLSIREQYNSSLAGCWVSCICPFMQDLVGLTNQNTMSTKN